MSSVKREDGITQIPLSSCLSADGPESGPSHALARKRPRITEGSDDDAYDIKKPTPGEPSFKEMVDALDEQAVRNTLVRLASMAPSAQSAIRKAYTQLLREEEQQHIPPSPKDYDYLSKEVWHMLYTSPAARRFRDATWYDRKMLVTSTAQDIAWKVHGMFQNIEDTAPFATKLNVLETFRKILKSVLLGKHGQLAGEIRHQFTPELSRLDHPLTPLILYMPGDFDDLVMSMSEEERIRAGRSGDEKGTLGDKFEWIRNEARRAGLRSFMALDHLLEYLGVPSDNHTWDDVAPYYDHVL